MSKSNLKGLRRKLSLAKAATFALELATHVAKATDEGGHNMLSGEGHSHGRFVRVNPDKSETPLSGRGSGGRTYLAPGEKPPAGVRVQQGPRGGKYYESAPQRGGKPSMEQYPRSHHGEEGTPHSHPKMPTPHEHAPSRHDPQGINQPQGSGQQGEEFAQSDRDEAQTLLQQYTKQYGKGVNALSAMRNDLFATFFQLHMGEPGPSNPAWTRMIRAHPGVLKNDPMALAGMLAAVKGLYSASR